MNVKKLSKQEYYNQLESKVEALRKAGYESGYALTGKFKSAVEKRPTITEWTTKHNTETVQQADISFAIRNARQKYGIDANEYRMLGAYLRTGCESGMVVVDFDKKNCASEDDFVEKLTWLQDKLGCATVETPSGGLHWWITIPNADNPDYTIPSKKYNCVDIKSDGGQVIIPPTIYVDYTTNEERYYTFIKNADGKINRLTIDDNIFDIITKQIPENFGSATQTAGGTGGDAFVSPDIIQNYLENDVIPEGSRNNTIFAILQQMYFNWANEYELTEAYHAMIKACDGEEDLAQQYIGTLNGFLTSRNYKRKEEGRNPEIKFIDSKGITFKDDDFVFYKPQNGKDWINVENYLVEKAIIESEGKAEKLQKEADKINDKHYKRQQMDLINDYITNELNKYQIFYFEDMQKCYCFNSNMNIDDALSLYPGGFQNWSDIYFLLYPKIKNYPGFEGYFEDKLNRCIKTIYAEKKSNKIFHRQIYRNKYFDKDNQSLYIYLDKNRYLKIRTNETRIVNDCPQILTGNKLPDPDFNYNAEEIYDYITKFWALDYDIQSVEESVVNIRTLNLLTFMAHVFVPGISKKCLCVIGETGSGKTPLMAGISSLYTDSYSLKNNIIGAPTEKNDLLRTIYEWKSIICPIDDFNATQNKFSTARKSVEGWIVNLSSNRPIDTLYVKYEKNIDVNIDGAFMFTTSERNPWHRTDVNKRTEYIELDVRVNRFEKRYMMDDLIIKEFKEKIQTKFLGFIFDMVRQYMVDYSSQLNYGEDEFDSKSNYLDYEILKKMIVEKCGKSYKIYNKINTEEQDIRYIDELESDIFTKTFLDLLSDEPDNKIKKIHYGDLMRKIFDRIPDMYLTTNVEEMIKTKKYYLRDNQKKLSDLANIKFKNIIGRKNGSPIKLWTIDGSKSEYVVNRGKHADTIDLTDNAINNAIDENTEEVIDCT